MTEVKIVVRFDDITVMENLLDRICGGREDWHTADYWNHGLDGHDYTLYEETEITFTGNHANQRATIFKLTYCPAPSRFKNFVKSVKFVSHVPLSISLPGGTLSAPPSTVASRINE
jgi:hypothetical protein